MDLGAVFHNLIFDYTLRTVALGSAVLGLVSGSLGTFAVLRRQSLLGDSVSHTALPGIALAFLLTGSKAPLVMIIGAAVAGWGGTLLVISIVRQSRIKMDSALGMILSVFFGFGLVLLTFIQKRPDARQAGLEKFLFGQATALMERDVIVMAILGALVLIIVGLFWKEFKLLSFDREFGSSMGLSMHRAEILLTTILVIAIVIGLQTVGVVLMSAMVVAPAAAARQWTDRLGLMVVLAAIFGAVAGVGGAVISSLTERLPTGPTIVLCISGIVIISMLFAGNRGLFWNRLRRRRSRKKLALEAVLLDMYELARQHGDREHGHPLTTLQAMSFRPGSVSHTLQVLEEKGWVLVNSAGEWSLSADGYKAAEKQAAAMEAKR